MELMVDGNKQKKINSGKIGELLFNGTISMEKYIINKLRISNQVFWLTDSW